MVEEVNVIDTQVTEDPQGIIGAHLEEELQGTEGGEAGAAVLASLAVQYATVTAVIAVVEAPSAVALLWRGHHVLKGEDHLQRAGAHRSHEIHRLRGAPVEVIQGRLLVVPLGRQALSHMGMALPILRAIKLMIVMVLWIVFSEQACDLRLLCAGRLKYGEFCDTFLSPVRSLVCTYNGFF